MPSCTTPFPESAVQKLEKRIFNPLISVSQIKLLQLLFSGLILQQSMKNYNKLKLATLRNRLKLIKTKSYSLLTPFRHHVGYSFLFEKRVKYFYAPLENCLFVFLFHNLFYMHCYDLQFSLRVDGG